MFHGRLSRSCFAVALLAGRFAALLARRFAARTVLTSPFGFSVCVQDDVAFFQGRENCSGHAGIVSNGKFKCPLASISQFCHCLSKGAWPICANAPGGACSRRIRAHARHISGMYLDANLVFHTFTVLPEEDGMLTFPSSVSSCVWGPALMQSLPSSKSAGKFVLSWLGFLYGAPQAQQSYRIVTMSSLSKIRAMRDTENSCESHGCSTETKIFEDGRRSLCHPSRATHCTSALSQAQLP